LERLKQVIQQHRRWEPLEEYIDRIEAYADLDFGLAIGNAKALLESIAKEICKCKEEPIEGSPSVNSLMKAAFRALGYSGKDSPVQISSALATIGQHIGEIRNKIDTAAHGKVLDEIRKKNQNIDDLTKIFLIDSTTIVAYFLIQKFENEYSQIDFDLDYSACSEFNEYIDEQLDEFTFGVNSYKASKVLFSVDYSSYAAEHKAFLLDPPEL